jgi:uncharacterized membrane protein (DUF2068 family)
MDWSLLGCGASGHVTFAPDQPELRGRLSVSTREGTAWRCLRCGTFVIGEPTSSGPVSSAPRVRRDNEVRSALILRVFAVERFLRAIIFGGLAIAVWRFSSSRLSIEQAYDQMLPAVRTLLRELGFNVNHSKLLGLIQHAFRLNPHTLTLLALAAGAYAVIEVIEGVGLWLLKRWGEYFAMIATSVGIPYEIYDLTAKVTWLRVVAFIINVALVVYLVVSKRLFGVRGGKKAYEARLRSESILQAEVDALPAGETNGAGEMTGAGELTGAGDTTGTEEAAQVGKTAQAGMAVPTGEAAAAAAGARRDGGTADPGGTEAPGVPAQPGQTKAPAATGQPSEATAPGGLAQPGRATEPAGPDQPGRAAPPGGPDQPTDAAATRSSAAE